MAITSQLIRARSNIEFSEILYTKYTQYIVITYWVLYDTETTSKQIQSYLTLITRIRVMNVKSTWKSHKCIRAWLIKRTQNNPLA